MSRGIQFSRACQGCGKPIVAGAWCVVCADTDPDAPQRPMVESPYRRENEGGHWSQARDRQEQNEFRRRLVRAYGDRCAAVGPLGDATDRAAMPFADLEPGKRCTETTDLFAHHGKGKTIDMLLCRRHHKDLDPFAR